MSVLIKGMKMPKNCYGCCFFHQVDYWNRDNEADILSCCKRTGEKTFDDFIKYLPNCPLVPIPEYGRLIDADALMHSVSAETCDCNPDHFDLKDKEGYGKWMLHNGINTGITAAIVRIRSAPAIISADELV